MTQPSSIKFLVPAKITPTKQNLISASHDLSSLSSIENGGTGANSCSHTHHSANQSDNDIPELVARIGPDEPLNPDMPVLVKMQGG
jgi:hypothetical protein